MCNNCNCNNNCDNNCKQHQKAIAALKQMLHDPKNKTDLLTITYILNRLTNKPHPRHQEIVEELANSLESIGVPYGLTSPEINRIVDVIARKPKVVAATLQLIDAADEDGIFHSLEADEAIIQYDKDVMQLLKNYTRQFILDPVNR